MTAKRANIEQEMLREFIKIAKEHEYPLVLGQGSDNRIKLEGNLYFQFGDLRVDTPSSHVVIEVETAGGVTNLVKYWYCFKKRIITKPIVLLHIFKTSSKSDYGSHLLLWDYLWSSMNNDLGNQIVAKRFKVGTVNELGDALKYFKEAILGKIK